MPKTVKKIVTKKATPKKVETVEKKNSTCSSCTGTGLKDRNTLCIECEGSGKV